MSYYKIHHCWNIGLMTFCRRSFSLEGCFVSFIYLLVVWFCNNYCKILLQKKASHIFLFFSIGRKHKQETFSLAVQSIFKIRNYLTYQKALLVWVPGNPFLVLASSWDKGSARQWFALGKASSSLCSEVYAWKHSSLFSSKKKKKVKQIYNATLKNSIKYLILSRKDLWPYCHHGNPFQQKPWSV